MRGYAIKRSKKADVAAKPPRSVKTLSPTEMKQIDALVTAADYDAEDGNYQEALDAYWAAWEILPEPKTEWDVALVLLGSIGDMNFLMGQFAEGVTNLSMAMHCKEAIGNPFLHMRLGQCQFEIGNLPSAKDDLRLAHIAEGDEMFANEDPKYLVFLVKD